MQRTELKKKDTKVETRQSSQKVNFVLQTWACDMNIRTFYQRMRQQSAFWWGCWPGLECCSGLLYCSEISRSVPLLKPANFHNTEHYFTEWPSAGTRVSLSGYEWVCVCGCVCSDCQFCMHDIFPCVGISSPRARLHVSNCLHLRQKYP